MVSAQKAAMNAAKNLIVAVKAAIPESDDDKSRFLEAHQFCRAASGVHYVLRSVCLDSIDKAVAHVQRVTGSYPPDEIKNRLVHVVVEAKDKSAPIKELCEALAHDVTSLVIELTALGSWQVLIAVRGIQTYDEAFWIGNVRFNRLSESQSRHWGQRLATGQVDPPGNSPVPNSWFETDAVLRGQAVAVVDVQAVDPKHAQLEARRAVAEAMDLLRYGQLTVGWPPEPVPQFGLTAMSAHRFIQSYCICVRLDSFGTSANYDVAASEGAITEYCIHAPGWDELHALLKTPSADRTEIQRRMISALAWVGQAALAQKNSVRLIGLMTALEILLVQQNESLGKRRKLSTRIQQFPQLPTAGRKIDAVELDRLYKVRSACLHAGKDDVPERDIKIAGVAVAQVLRGILCDERLRRHSTLAALLADLNPVLAEPMNWQI